MRQTAMLLEDQQNASGFYPTPPALAQKMLAGIDWHMIGTVLEPSAGKGDLAESMMLSMNSVGLRGVYEVLRTEDKRGNVLVERVFHYDRSGIDCVEIDPNLRHILTGKGARVVHDDFLTFQTCKRYDLIVMNPPFDRGDAHLLHALELLEQRWPNVPRWRDIRTLTGESFYERTGLRTVDVVSGGFPCQPFSVAGQRRGAEDDRYLWPEMLRVISEIQPTWVIGENVAGLVSMAEPIGQPRVESRTIGRYPDQDDYHGVSTQQERMYLHGILQDLCSLGYEVAPFVVPACGVDAQHQRYRIAIVGHAKHDGSPAATVSGGAGEDGDGRAQGA